MSTAARIYSNEASHWYHHDGRPCYEVARADGEGMRATTIADARKLKLLPSVTNVLKILAKPALVDWKIEQAVLAAVTSPRLAGEQDDAFVYRVMQKEAQQDREAQMARERGTQIHDAMQGLMCGSYKLIDLGELRPWVEPVFGWMNENAGSIVHSEVVLIGDGYAGKTDLITQRLRLYETLWDYKSCKKLPDPAKGGYIENKLQLAAYSVCRGDVRYAANVYISTTQPGAFVVIEYSNEELTEAYERCFKPLLEVWRYVNKYNL